jgi:hypothetical protein
MIRSTLFLSALLLSLALLHAAPPTSKGQADFERLKSLVGDWEGESPDGTAHVSYTVVSNGSAVMENLGHTGMTGMMISMYHLDGDRLMMTHYCSIGNQPRMRLVKSTATELTFEMFDATNLASKSDAHMRKLVISWTDKDHVTAIWTMTKDGKDQEKGVFKLTRKG